MSALHEAKRRGLAAPRTREEKAAYEADKAARRLKNVVNAREILDRNGINYQETKLLPAGTLFVIHAPKAIWYYPEDGRWYAQGEPVHFGCRNLIRFLVGRVI